MASRLPFRSHAAAAATSGMPMAPPIAIRRIRSVEIVASGRRMTERMEPTNGIEITRPASALQP